VPVAALEIIAADHRRNEASTQEDTDAVADAGAATVNGTAATANETDNCEVCLVAQREPRLALVP